MLSLSLSISLSPSLVHTKQHIFNLHVYFGKKRAREFIGAWKVLRIFFLFLFICTHIFLKLRFSLTHSFAWVRTTPSVSISIQFIRKQYGKHNPYIKCFGIKDSHMHTHAIHSTMMLKYNIKCCYCWLFGLLHLAIVGWLFRLSNRKFVRFSFALTHLIAFSVAIVWLPDRRLVVIHSCSFALTRSFFHVLLFHRSSDAFLWRCIGCVLHECGQKVRWCRRSLVYCTRTLFLNSIHLRVCVCKPCAVYAFWLVCRVMWPVYASW